MSDTGKEGSFMLPILLPVSTSPKQDCLDYTHPDDHSLSTNETSGLWMGHSFNFFFATSHLLEGEKGYLFIK